jgi:hypothetical protein
VSGCNLFDLQSSEPGSEADRLQEQLKAFILPMSKITLTIADIFETAKQTRQRTGLGVLETTQLLLRPTDGERVLSFPFENLTPGQRDALLPDLRVIDQATTLIVMAHQEGIRRQSTSRPARSLQYTPSDEQLRLVARRVIVTPQFAPCSVYPDFIIARLLRIMLEFRTELPDTSGISVVGTDRGYAVVWLAPSNVTESDAAKLNAAIADLRSTIDAELKPYFDPFEALGCDVQNTEIIDPAVVEAFAYEVLLPSLELYRVNTGAPGNDGIGDTDGDGQVDEEIIDGNYNDGDGLIDEDARL